MDKLTIIEGEERLKTEIDFLGEELQKLLLENGRLIKNLDYAKQCLRNAGFDNLAELVDYPYKNTDNGN